MQHLQITGQRLRDTEILHLVGAIDDGNFGALGSVLANQLRECRSGGAVPQIILECGNLQHISSSALRELLDLAHRARSAGGDIKCVRLSPTIEQISNLISNGDPLDCYPDVSYALEAFHSVTA